MSIPPAVNPSLTIAATAIHSAAPPTERSSSRKRTLLNDGLYFTRWPCS